MATTLTQLKARTLRRADMSDDTEFIDTSSGGELEVYIQASARELYDLIIEAYGSDYYYSSSSLNTVADSPTVDLPADFYKLLGVDATIGGITEPITLANFNWNERNRYLTAAGWSWWNVRPRYRLRAGKLWFLPTPNAVYPITIHYVPRMTDIDDSTNAFDGINGWDEFIELKSAIKCLNKEESDTGSLMAELDDCTKRIKSSAPVRDIDQAFRVKDVYASHITTWDDL
jgi:hypothetical protein